MSAETANALPQVLKPMFVVGGLYSLANGVAWIMRDLAAALGRAGAPVDVYAADCWGRGAASIGHIFDPPSRWISRKGMWIGGLSWSPQLKPVMRRAVAEHDIVHNHSLWMLPNSYSARAAFTLHKPLIITAHGALEPWALSNASWKKQLVGAMFQRSELLRADCLQTNSRAEIDGLRRYGITAPVAVIPNGVDLPVLDQPAARHLLEARHPDLANKRWILFMARLHVKKGIEHLLRAWAQLAASHPDWQLVVAGPDNGFEAASKAIVSSLSIDSRVTFTGNLQGDLSRAARQGAEIFAQPSFSEGFSMAILEAMASRCPVLITPGCNFPEAADAGAGLIVAPDVESTADGLARLLEMSDAERQQMGERGRQLIERGFTWDRVAKKTLELYRWTLSGGPSPDFVAT
ncbi:MAG: glycosyltransferase [Planctomycetaceae bacterium]|nr:glycosyltransferase [Planctomycetaceae bacterium]